MTNNLTIGEIKNAIHHGLGPILFKDNFEAKKAGTEFTKAEGYCIYKINILLTSWSTSFSITLRPWIIQKEIEKIYKSVLGSSHGLTCCPDSIDDIYNSPDGRHLVKGKSLGIWLTQKTDLNDAIDLLSNYYENIIKPYFGKLNMLSTFDDYLNNPPFEYSPAYVGGFVNDRCIKGLIAAKLVGNANYEKLVAVYDDLIKETISDVQPDSQIDYIKVKQYLEQTGSKNS